MRVINNVTGSGGAWMSEESELVKTLGDIKDTFFYKHKIILVLLYVFTTLQGTV